MIVCKKRDTLPYDASVNHISKMGYISWGFPDSSVGKESACNVGDPSWIAGLGRSPGEGIGYLFQYSWASLVAQLVKNLRETWVRSLGWEDSPGEGKGYPFQYSGLENSMDLIVHGVAESDMTEQLSLSAYHK